jgi:hypothetical protein
MATRVRKRRVPVSASAKQTTRWPTRGVFARADWWMWSFLPLGLFYLILAAAHVDHILVNVYGSSDASSSLVVAEYFGDRAGGHIITSNFPWDSTLIFEEATKWLPAHRQIWELGPYLIALLSIALMSWAALRVGGRWAAALTAMILLCAGPAVLELMFWLTNHTTTWYSLALLAAYLVLLTDREVAFGWLPLTLITLCVGAIVGINAATDKELLAAGLAPLLLAGIATWAVSRTVLAARAMWCAVAVTAVTGISALATRSIMQSAGVITNGYKVTFAGIEVLATNVTAWWQSTALLGNGDFFGEAITFRSVLAFVCAVVSVGVVLLIPRFAWRYFSSGRAVDEPLDVQLSLYTTFWGAVVVFLSAGFIFSSAPIHPTTPENTGYLVGLLYAVAAMLPLLARRSAALRTVVLVGTLVFLLNAILALGRSAGIKAPRPAYGPSPQVAQDVARVAERMHATYGYGLYGDSAAITWRTNFRVLVAPIVGCQASPTKLCPGPNGYLEAWYAPTPRRTFVLTDTSIVAWTPPTALGPAIATYHFGTVTMYVYNYNVVGRLL